MNLVRILALIFIATEVANGQDLSSSTTHIMVDIPYRSGDGLSEYEKERCKLDVYLPRDRPSVATLIWFHGGGLKNGDKRPNSTNDSVSSVELAKSFADDGVAVVVPNYRLSPKATFPSYIEDAAASVAWAMREMPKLVAKESRFYIGGHSAGGYLALMIALDPRYLSKCGVELDRIAGVIPVSGQTMTHYTVREERGIGKHTITADDAAPVYFAKADTTAILLLYADGDLPARAEENAYFLAVMKDAGNKKIEGHLLLDRTHSTIASSLRLPDDPGRQKMLTFMGAPKNR
jgi:acetyl esterase/lipase